MNNEEVIDYVVTTYGVPAEWCVESNWEEHRLIIKDEGVVLFDGTIKKLIETIKEEDEYFGKSSGAISNL